MKKFYFILSFFLICMFATVQLSYGQYGTIKFCPNTPAWKANKAMVENAKEMYEEYAKGPDGCWWLKTAKFTSYKEGYYQFDYNGTKYYYNAKKKFWENWNRTQCLATPPFGK